MSERGKAIYQAGRELSKNQKIGRDTATAKRVEEQYQKALDQAAERIDQGNAMQYIELTPYCRFVAEKLRADGFKEVQTDEGIIFSWSEDR